MNEENLPKDDCTPACGNGCCGCNGIPKEEKTMGLLCHLLALCGFVVPLGNFIGPLIVWLIKKDEMPFVDDQGKESLNFQITLFIAYAVCAITAFLIIPIFIAIGLAIISIIFPIIGAIKANDGVKYRYPLTIRFIK